MWPVSDGEDCALVLKVSRPTWPIEPEVVALRAWDGHGAVECHAYSRHDNAVLLRRLDAKMDSGFARIERKLDQFIDTQSKANELVERRLNAL